MAYHKGGKGLGGYPVDESPDRPCHEGCHHEHEVEGPDVDEGIYQCRDYEGQVGRMLPAEKPREGALDIAPPEEFLGRPDQEQQEQGYQPLRKPRFHRIYVIDLGAGEVEEEGRGLVPYPENAPERKGQKDTDN